MRDTLLIQDCLFRGLLSCGLFKQFNVVLEKEFLASADLDVKRLYVTRRIPEGPVGIGLLVEMPKLITEKPNSLQRKITAGVIAVEHREMNFRTGGSAVAAEDLAEMVLDFMFGWRLGLTSGLSPESGGVGPAHDKFEGPGIVPIRASMSLRREFKPSTRCAVPSCIEGPPGTFTLASATEGAAIYYTLDQTLPGSAGATAVKYEAPVALAVGAIISYAAWRDDLLPSHIQSQVIS